MRKNPTLIFAAQQGLYWCAFGFFNSYIATIALARGFSPSLVSSMLAMAGLASLLGMTVGSFLSDRMKTNKKVFLLCLTLLLPLNIGLYLCSDPTLFYGLYLLSMLINGPVYPNLDTWILRSSGFSVKVYGQSRSIGAMGMAVGMLLTGFLIKRMGYSITIIGSTAVYLLVLLLSLTVKDSPFPPHVQSRPAATPMKVVMRPAFLLLCAVMLFLGFTVNPFSNLKIMVLRAVGGDVDWQGIDMFFAMVVQFLCLFFSERLSRRSTPQMRLLRSAGFMLLTVVAAYIATAPWMVVVASCIQQAGFGTMIATVRQMTAATVPSEHQTFANSLVDAFYTPVANVLCLPVAGVLVERSGTGAMLRLSWITGVAALLLTVALFWLSRRHDRQRAAVPVE